MNNKIFHQLKEGYDKQLICFPYLGGYINSYFKLANYLSDKIEVWSSNPPGHGSSSSEPLRDVHSLLDLYFCELKKIVKSPYILFGHSMGAIVAYFLAQKIFNSAQYPIKPTALVLSASNTPAYFDDKKISALPNDKLIERILIDGGIRDVIIKEKTLVEYFIPIYRADFMILESAAMLDYEPLDVPVYFLWGENDKIVSFDEIIKWSNYFINKINLIPVKNGNHMFIDDQTNTIAKKIDYIFKQVLKIQLAPIGEEQCY